MASSNSFPPKLHVERLPGAFGGGASVKAALTTALAGANNDLTYTAQDAGDIGNSITIRYVDPAAASAALSVSVLNRAITVNLATNGSSVITSTAAQVAAAVNGSASASALVVAANAAANDGTGVVTALASTPLAGGDTARGVPWSSGRPPQGNIHPFG